MTDQAVAVQLNEMLDEHGFVQLLLALEEAGAVTETSLVLTDPTMTYERYEALGVYLGRMKRWTSWAIGDWLNFGEGTYGHDFAQAVAETRLNEQTLLHYQDVCRNVPASRRNASLAFGVHALVRRLDAKEQTYWLKQSVRKGWGERELRAALKAKKVEGSTPLEPLFDDYGGGARTPIVEAAEAILRDAQASEENLGWWLVPDEDIERLRVVLNERQ